MAFVKQHAKASVLTSLEAVLVDHSPVNNKEKTNQTQHDYNHYHYYYPNTQIPSNQLACILINY